MEIIRSSTKLINIVTIDQIPFVELVLGRIQQVAEIFNVQEMSLDAKSDNKRFNLNSGTFEFENSAIKIYRLEIEDRKVVIHLEGKSEEAEIIYEVLKSLFNEISERDIDNFMEPVLSVFESEAVLHLDFDYQNLFSEGLNEFVTRDLLELAERKYGEPSLFLETVTFKMPYTLTDEKLHEYRINLVAKDVTIAPRPGSLMEDRHYVLQAPVQTKKLFELGERLESRLSDQVIK
jgi:hypothetical protein